MLHLIVIVLVPFFSAVQFVPESGVAEFTEFSFVSSLKDAVWDFGDGSKGTGMSITHVFHKSGVHSVSVRSGTTEERFSVMVEPLPKLCLGTSSSMAGEPVVFSDLTEYPGEVSNVRRKWVINGVEYEADSVTETFNSPIKLTAVLYATLSPKGRGNPVTLSGSVQVTIVSNMIYVDSRVKGNVRDGTTWSTAFQSISDALLVAPQRRNAIVFMSDSDQVVPIPSRGSGSILVIPENTRVVGGLRAGVRYGKTTIKVSGRSVSGFTSVMSVSSNSHISGVVVCPFKDINGSSIGGIVSEGTTGVSLFDSSVVSTGRSEKGMKEAIRFESSKNVDLLGVSVSGNGGPGYAVVFSNCMSGLVRNLTVVDNNLGVLIKSSNDIRIDSSVFSSNGVDNIGNGGALRIEGSRSSVVASMRMYGNKARFGGSVYVDINSDLAVLGCRGYDNQAVSGSFAYAEGQLRIEQCVLDAGAVSKSETLLFNGPASILSKSTLNGPGLSSGLVRCGSELVVKDSIVWNAQKPSIVMTGAAKIQIDHSTVSQRDLSGSAVSFIDPMFESVDSKDFRLKPGSYCVGTATPEDTNHSINRGCTIDFVLKGN